MLLLFVNGIGGTMRFARATADPPKRPMQSSCFPVMMTNRQAYGILFAEQGFAPTVLLSTPPGPKDQTMQSACQPRSRLQVLCSVAAPWTPRGEAIMTRHLAEKYGWKSVIVVSSRFHLPRARRIFEQCFTSPGRSVLMHEVPRSYAFSVARWQYIYLYQYAAWVNAEILGACA